MDRLAIEFISVFGMPPVEFIELAARLECRNIGLAPSPIVALADLYPAWDLRGNAGLQKDVAKALEDNGVAISLAEGFLILPGQDVSALAGDLDLMAGLGAHRANVCCIESDFGRTVEAFGKFADLAGERGMSVTAEFLPGIPIENLTLADALVTQANRPDTGVLVDAMHLFRSGSTADDLRALNPAHIGYAQLCDVPLVAKIADYADEARFERLAPGDGELPLLDFVRALPRDVMIGLEIPMRSLAERGVGPAERLAPAIAKARALIAQAG